MPLLACPSCGAGVTRFKKRGRCYVRCKQCRAERTERQSRAAALSPPTGGTVDQDGDDDQQWGGDEQETTMVAILEEQHAVPIGLTDMEAVDMLVSLSTLPSLGQNDVDAVQPHNSPTAAEHALPVTEAVQNDVSRSNAMIEPLSLPSSEVEVCRRSFSELYSTAFISHLLSNVDCFQANHDAEEIDNGDAVSMQTNERESSTLSEDSHSSGLSDGCMSCSGESAANDPLIHSFVQASDLSLNDLGISPSKILINNVVSKDVSCIPDIDGYRLLLSKGVDMKHHLKVRYTPQDIEHRPANVSFKIGSHRVSGKKLLFYRLAKVADIDCKLFLCVAFFKEYPKSMHSAMRSIHASVCKALQETDPDAPTRELSIRHGDNCGPKGKHIVDQCRSQAFLNGVIRHCQRIQFPNVGEYSCGIVIERFGQKQMSGLSAGCECELLEYITNLKPSVIVDGCVDIGMMFRSVEEGHRLSCLWDRNALSDMYGKRVRLHSKSLLGQYADGTVKHGVNNPVQKEKFYTSDVYLWRLQGKIPFRLLDASSSFLLSIPMFNEGLSASMRNLLTSNGGASEQDINLVRQAFADLSDKRVQARYEITVHAQHFSRYRAGILALCRLVPIVLRTKQLPCIKFILSAAYASYLSRLATHFVDTSSLIRTKLRDQLFTKACHHQCQESGYGRVFSGTEHLLASLCVYQDLFILLLTGDSIYLRFRKLMNRLGIAEQMRQHGILATFDPATIDRVLSNSPNLFDYNSFFFAWAYPLIKRRTSSAARELVCFRLSS